MGDNRTDIKILILCGLMGMLAAVFAGYALGFIMPYFPKVSQDYSAGMEQFFTGGITALLYVVVITPVFEELLFRKLIQSLLSGFTCPFFANLIQALVFGIYHGNIIQKIYAFLLGLLLGFMKEKTGGIIYCIAFHCFFNIAGVIIDRLSYIEQPPGLRIVITAGAFAGAAASFYFIIRSRNGCDPQTG